MKPVTKRATRVADQIRMEVADILMRKVRDPRLRAVTVTEVSVTNDLRLARVYFTAGLDGMPDREIAAGAQVRWVLAAPERIPLAAIGAQPLHV